MKCSIVKSSAADMMGIVLRDAVAPALGASLAIVLFLLQSSFAYSHQLERSAAIAV